MLKDIITYLVIVLMLSFNYHAAGQFIGNESQLLPDSVIEIGDSLFYSMQLGTFNFPPKDVDNYQVVLKDDSIKIRTCIGGSDLPAPGTVFDTIFVGHNFSPGNYIVQHISGLVPIRFLESDSLCEENVSLLSYQDTAYYSFTVERTTSNHEVEKGGFYIYPNPFRDHLNILNNDFSNSSERVLHIYDSMGRLVQSHLLQAKQAQMIPTSSLTDGIYFIEIVDESDGRSISKLVKY